MYQGKKLGQWINNQRHLYNVGKLSKERERLLRKKMDSIFGMKMSYDHLLQS